MKWLSELVQDEAWQKLTFEQIRYRSRFLQCSFW